MRRIPFVKMSGSGNDFILIDNRRKILNNPDLKGFVARICQHRLSVGGDGVILIEPPSVSRRGRKAAPDQDPADFKWRLFNADGSEAELSGNGGRCAARFAYLKKIAGRRLAFETLAGVIRAEVKKDSVKIQMPEAKDLRLNISVPVEGKNYLSYFLNTGVPHVVLYVPDIDSVDVVGLGRKIRHHSLFKPAGTNVNFVALQGEGILRLRTYERGVEEETLACGSGSVAAALISGALGKGRSPLTVIQQSGKQLKVYFRWDGATFSETFLEGDAMMIYEGEMWEEAWK